MAYAQNKFFSILLVVGFLGLASCAKKDDTAVVRVANRSGVVTSGGGSSLPQNCPTGASAVGKIYDSRYSYVTDYRPTVVSFLSSILTENYIGQISTSPYDKTGIDFVAQFKFDGTGVVLKNGTMAEMSFFDSMVGTTDSTTGVVIPAYPVKLISAVAGQRYSNGQFVVKFQDEYGEVTFTSSQTSSGYVYGKVTYVNSKNVNGGTPTSGTLGDFVIPACGLF